MKKPDMLNCEMIYVNDYFFIITDDPKILELRGGENLAIIPKTTFQIVEEFLFHEDMGPFHSKEIKGERTGSIFVSLVSTYLQKHHPKLLEKDISNSVCALGF